MSQSQNLLEKLSEWRPAEGRQSLTVNDSATGWSTTLCTDRADALGCLVWELTLRKNSPIELSLGEWANRAANRSTGLLENLKVVEIDEGLGKALLRSESPAARGDEVSYYEVLLVRAGQAELRRFNAARMGSGKREQTAFAVTHEALAKLAVDLTDAR